MIEHERKGFGIEPRVERVEDAAGHRSSKVCLDHLRRIGEHRRHRVADGDATSAQCGSEAPRTIVGFLPRVTPIAVDDGNTLRPGVGNAGQERYRRQRRIVRGVAIEIAGIRIH
jgi:hypothetical protein